MDKNLELEKKLLLEGKFEDVIEINEHYFIKHKKDKLCVLPYTISSENLLDKIGIIENWNHIEEKEIITLINDYISTDDKNNLVAANRILYEVIGINIENADLWMYLGNVYNNLTFDSPIKLYAVDISDIKIKTDEKVENESTRKKFKMISSSKVVQSDDILFLSTYLRLFQYFYINSLNNE